jgi:predicted peptidase
MAGAKWFAVAVVLCAYVVVPARAGETKHGFVNKVFKGDKGDSKYVLFVPHKYDGEKEYPLILFLHGAGEKGDDGESPVRQGIGNAIKFKGKEKDFPFFVIFPQAAKNGSWKAGGPDADRALAILAETQKSFKIDDKRLYLTGLSMGGFGTWSLAAAHPDKWAAIVPICGGGDPKNAEKIKDIPCWCFCGDKDSPQLLNGCRNMVKALKEAGGQPRYSEFPYVGHNSWDSAYVTPELYPWLLSHKRK